MKWLFNQELLEPLTIIAVRLIAGVPRTVLKVKGTSRSDGNDVTNKLEVGVTLEEADEQVAQSFHPFFAIEGLLLFLMFGDDRLLIIMMESCLNYIRLALFGGTRLPNYR